MSQINQSDEDKVLLSFIKEKQRDIFSKDLEEKFKDHYVEMEVIEGKSKFIRSGFGQTLLHKQSWPPSKFRVPVRESDESSLTADDFVPQIRDV